jgi:hypothetical protein
MLLFLLSKAKANLLFLHPNQDNGKFFLSLSKLRSKIGRLLNIEF